MQRAHLPFALVLLAAAAGARAPAPGCDPPLPAPGETVRWTAALSPIQICQNALVPAGGTVEIDAGVVVDVPSGVTLTVDGELLGVGTQALPLSFTGAGAVVVGGRAAIAHASIALAFQRGPRGAVLLSEATVASGQLLSSLQRDALLSLEHVVIQRGQPTAFGQIAMRDVWFQAPDFALEWSGYFLADGVTIDGRPLTVVADHQPRLLSDVDVTGTATSPVLTINGGGATPGTSPLIEASCDLAGGSVPVLLRIGGLHPESVLPTSGSARNAVLLDVGSASGVCDLPRLSIPYYMPDDVTFSGRVRIGPGALFEQEAAAGFEVRGGAFEDTSLFRGAPDEPVLIRRATPGIRTGGVALFSGTAQYVDVEGGALSSISGLNEILECTVRASEVGLFGDDAGFGIVRGCRVLDNEIGVEDDPTSATTIDLNGSERPNVFEGNTLAARNNSPPSGSTGVLDASFNWWGHPSGPQSAFINPEGQGDPIGFAVTASPWLTAPPNLADDPPFVTLESPFLLTEPGDTVYLTWDVEDDGAVVSQRIRMDASGGGAPAWFTLLDDLAPAQRSAFVRIPFIGQHVDARSTRLRVEATDDAGQAGKQDVTLQVPVNARPDGFAQFLTDTSAGFFPGEEVRVCYDALNQPTGNLVIYLVMDTEENALKNGANGTSGLGSCSFSALRFPRVSTNRARFAIFSDGPGNDDDWYFSEPFSIRPHPEFPDAPPALEVTSPSQGDRFAGGRVVPLRWTASDDEGLREFRVQTSLNGGRTWNVVARLAGTARAFDWRLPALDTTLDDVRVRVIAVDHRFQSTADGDERSLAFDPGAPSGERPGAVRASGRPRPAGL